MAAALTRFMPGISVLRKAPSATLPLIGCSSSRQRFLRLRSAPRRRRPRFGIVSPRFAPPFVPLRRQSLTNASFAVGEFLMPLTRCARLLGRIRMPRYSSLSGKIRLPVLSGGRTSATCAGCALSRHIRARRSRRRRSAGSLPKVESHSIPMRASFAPFVPSTLSAGRFVRVRHCFVRLPMGRLAGLASAVFI